MIGQIINYRYEVLEKIGDSELFSVYKSRDKVLNRLVALKVLSRDLIENNEYTAAVRTGYQNVAGLDHPNIARVMESDPTSDDNYVVCEYARGTSVKDRVHRAGPIAVPLALDIIIPVLEALEYAHANRIIHGDIRSQDVIVSPDGEVKLTDFGLSAALRQCPDIANRYNMRSVHYEAPEIAEGASPSAASDLYSVGIVLYEMLTGVLPFNGPTAVAVALKQAKDLPVPPRSINTGVQKSLSDIVMRAIEKSPDERFPNASAMLTDLRAIRDALRVGKPTSIPQPSVSARHSGRAEETGKDVPEPSIKKSLVWLILVFTVVFLAFLGITMFVSMRHAELQVPPLLGKTWDEAQYAAKDAGIRLVDDGEAFSETYEAGQICSVVPPTGSKVSRDNPVVKVKVSKGPSQVAVPDLIGLPETEAYQAAEEKGFTISKVTSAYSDRIPINAVISQKPTPNMMETPGSSISLVVSQGPKPEDSTASEPESEKTGEERKLTVTVSVPEDSAGSQEVKIIVQDERGETTVYQQDHMPGDKFSETVTTLGPSARVMVYVGGQLVKDDTY